MNQQERENREEADRASSIRATHLHLTRCSLAAAGFLSIFDKEIEMGLLTQGDISVIAEMKDVLSEWKSAREDMLRLIGESP